MTNKKETKPASQKKPGGEVKAHYEYRGKGGEIHQRAAPAGAVLTTNDGVPIADNQNSLRAGSRGPTLVEDFVLQEKLTHFDRERIPERVVHARASLAHGYFELTRSLKKYTTAQVLTETGKKTPVVARLSTVAGGRGSADTVRDTRGFAVKFYTEQGNWDLVGNNIPVFFIQDAMKFPDLVHSVKPEPDRGFPSAASAHDTFWDFVSNMPETMHHLLWVMSDLGVPRSLRMIEGFGVHTFRLINAAGQSTFVKYHWKPRLGVHNLIWDEAVKIAGADPDFHRKDLWNAIEEGNGPVWDFGVQLFTEKDISQFDFDYLDPTKLIPEEVIPIEFVGHMKLDRNPANFFEENEMSAFSPMRIVPGMDFSSDPLLQGRLFSYLDAQVYRLGGPNFQQIPVNKPRCPMANFQRDGFAQSRGHAGQVAYEPNRLDRQSARSSPLGFSSHADSAEIEPLRTRARPATFADHFSQPRMFYRSQTKIQQQHICTAIVFELSKVQNAKIRERTVSQLHNIDSALALSVAQGLNLKNLPPAEPPAIEPKNVALSPGLDIFAKQPFSLAGKCIGILIADGSDANRLKSLQRKVQAKGAKTQLIAPKIGGVMLSNKKLQPVDGHLAGSPSVLFDAVIVLLQVDAAKHLSTQAAALEFVRDAYAHLKAIGYDEGASLLLKAAQIKSDEAVVDIKNEQEFLLAAQSREWQREVKLRPL